MPRRAESKPNNQRNKASDESSQSKQLQISEADLVQVLQSSLYPGAKAESVQMVIEYCRAAHLDVMKKPVHIVPMSFKNPQSGKYEQRDVIMPGIGFYRTQADRSNDMVGISEPEYGELVTQEFTDKNGKKVNVTFPEWCRVVAKKLVGGVVAEFVAKEYWLENYATDSYNSDAPNAMWRRRVRGQIAKCAEAQALRKGWPEIGAAPAAEEMEGKEILSDPTVIEGHATRVEPNPDNATEECQAQIARLISRAEKANMWAAAKDYVQERFKDQPDNLAYGLKAVQQARDQANSNAQANDSKAEPEQSRVA